MGIPLLIIWFVALSQGEHSFQIAQSLAGSVIGRIFLFGWTLAFFYHLLNGLRHLAWDAGFGLDLKNVYRSGYAVIIATLILSVICWILAYYFRGQHG